MSAPFAISATLKDLETYATESGVAYTTLVDWIKDRRFPAVKIGKRYMVSPIHALQWWEARMQNGEEEEGPKPRPAGRAGNPPLGIGSLAGDGGRPPQTRPGKR